MRIELHAHSTCSDGALTPAEVVARAWSAGVSLLSLTDHDTVGGLEEALRQAGPLGMEIVPGIELTADGPLEPVHVLGYFIDPDSPDLQHALRRRRERDAARGREIIRKLEEAGVRISFDRVARNAGGENHVRRFHIAQALVDARRVETVEEAFARYLGPRAPAYVPPERFSPERAAQLITAAGGVPVLAHPARYGEIADVEAILSPSFKGLEAYRPEHMASQTQALLDLARARGLIASGGSDFHGDITDRADLGGQYVPSQVIVELKRARPARSEAPVRGAQMP